MQRIGEHFGACNLQPKGSGSNKPRSQMHLQTCWVKFLPEIQTHRAAQPIWQKTRGQCMNFNVRWGGWKFIRALMRRVWWQNFWKIRLMISKQTYCICSIIFSTLEIFHHVGAGRFFRCWRRRRGRNNHQITGPLQTSVCCTKHLPSWFWVAHWRHRRLYSRNLAKAASTLEDERAKVCSIFVPTLCIHSSCFRITQTFPTAVQTPVPSMGYQGQCATGLQVSLTHSLILGRIEALLEAHQPEEQHGFRQHRRMDEHLLTATLFLDKAWDKGIPVWIVSLDLSKAFDRVNWNALWLALRDHGVSDHLIWILQSTSWEKCKVNIATAVLFPSTPECDKDVCWARVCFAVYCNGECQLGDKMQKHGNVVLTLAITWHFYWTYASLMISFYLHEQLQKQWLYWTIWYTNCRTSGCN